MMGCLRETWGPGSHYSHSLSEIICTASALVHFPGLWEVLSHFLERDGHSGSSRGGTRLQVGRWLLSW